MKYFITSLLRLEIRKIKNTSREKDCLFVLVNKTRGFHVVTQNFHVLPPNRPRAMYFYKGSQNNINLFHNHKRKSCLATFRGKYIATCCTEYSESSTRQEDLYIQANSHVDDVFYVACLFTWNDGRYKENIWVSFSLLSTHKVFPTTTRSEEVQASSWWMKFDDRYKFFDG